MSRIKLTNGFPKKPDAALRLGVILLGGEVNPGDLLTTPEGQTVPIEAVATVNVVTNERRAILSLPADATVDWHPYYGKELTVQVVSTAG